jgi:putative ABC transport system ATP-binding protein
MAAPVTSTNGTVFDVRALTKVYRMGEVEIHALRQVSLLLHEGHFVVLLGGSTCRRAAKSSTGTQT